jgi:hypothetical protein
MLGKERHRHQVQLTADEHGGRPGTDIHVDLDPLDPLGAEAT